MLQIDALRVSYEGVEALHDISLRIPKGSLTALIGPNGCGKSTLVKAMAGMLKPDAGAIVIDGADQARLSRRELAARVSYMPQSRPAPGITVRHLVAHGRYPHLKWGHSMTAGDRAIVAQALRDAGVEALAHRTLTQLSGGERQRAYLAMMLAQQTPVMLLDEPTTYLDLRSQFDMMALLTRLRDDGHTLVAVLHDLGLALEYADHILLMQSGRLITQGTPESVYRSGALQRVFRVEVRRTDEGRYVFSPEK